MGPLLRWFVFSVGFGLLPFGFSVLLRLLHGEPAALVRNAPELLFVSLMLSAIQMGELLEGPPAYRGEGGLVGALRATGFCVFLIVAVFAAMVYGVYVQALRTSEGYAAERWVAFESNVFRLAVMLAALAASLGTVAAFTRSRRKPCPHTST